MTIEHKEKLLTLNAFFQLRMAYAAVVNSYECHVRKNTRAVNRLLLVFKDDGRGDCVLRNPGAGQRFRMRAGCLYFIPCNLEVDLDITPGISFVSLHFNLDLFYGFDVFGSYRRCETVKNPSLVSETRQLLGREDELRTLCRVNEIIFRLCASWLPAQTSDIQKSLAVCRRYGDVLEFVQKAGDAATTVEALADMKGMRKDVFSRRFTRDVGVTPKDFISKTLMRKASKMLLSPGVTVRAVAEGLNFSSEYYFSRFFKKHSGQPPSVFQRGAGAHL